MAAVMGTLLSGLAISRWTRESERQQDTAAKGDKPPHGLLLDTPDNGTANANPNVTVMCRPFAVQDMHLQGAMRLPATELHVHGPR